MGFTDRITGYSGSGFVRTGSSLRGYCTTAEGYPCELTYCREGPLKALTVYGNSVQNGTPSADSPAEITGVGDRTANLFDKNKEPISKTANQVIYGIQLNKNTAYTLYVTSDAVTYTNLHPDENMNASELVARRETGNYYIPFNSGENTYLSIRFTKGTISEEYLSKIILTEGTFGASDKYEPYGYKLPLIMSGKNLFNVGDKNSSSWAASADTSGDWIKAEYDNTNGTSERYIGVYTNVSAELKTDTNYCIVTEIERAENCAVHTVTDNAYRPGQFTGSQVIYQYRETVVSNKINFAIAKTKNDFAGAETMLRTFIAVAAGAKGSCKIRISVLEDTSVTANSFVYEPYHEPQCFNIYLDEPLNKTGSISDTIELDIKNKSAVLTRKIGHLLFNGDEAWNNEGTDTSGIYRYQIAFDNYVSTDNVRNSAICTHFTTNTSSPTWTTENTFALSRGAKKLYIRTDGSSVEVFKAWLKEQYSAGTPVEIYYQYETPIVTDISDKINWDAIPEPWKGTITITSGTQIPLSNVEAEYYATKKIKEG
ncbi:MAG: hypothetical protein Q4G33_07550 [bacterium]|nr:hypothetical protein [bacterium]